MRANRNKCQLTSNIGKAGPDRKCHVFRSKIWEADTKRLIRNGSGQYLKPDGTWTSNIEDARSFASTLEVINAWQSYNFSDVQMVLIFDDKPSPKWDVVLPLGKGCNAHRSN